MKAAKLSTHASPRQLLVQALPATFEAIPESRASNVVTPLTRTADLIAVIFLREFVNVQGMTRTIRAAQ